MPRISTYTKDATIVDEDILLGSNYVRTYNGIKEYNTRSFKLEDLATYFNTKYNAASIDTDSITATELNISGNGSSGQFIMSDGDGSFSYLSILDEDNMSSNSATAPASQQSIKAYVDSQIATEDTIAELNDTTIGTLANAHLLIYDNDSSVWENKALSGDATITKEGVMSLASSQTNITSILNTSLVTGRDADNQIKYSTDNQIIFRVDGGDNVIFKTSGEIEATSLDISGDADIDGTTNLDAVDIDGAVQIDGNTTFGVNDTGVDVKFYGATSGRNMKWDESEDHLLFTDNTKLKIGTGADLQLYHDSSDSYVRAYNNDLIIMQDAADKDIIFKADDGSGSPTAYLTLDGSVAKTAVSKPLLFADNISAEYGADTDMIMYHSGGAGYIEHYTGNFNIIQHTNDGDIIFQCDDGSGGVTTYITIDGSATQTKFDKNARFSDSVRAEFGSSGDFVITHDGSDSKIENATGDLKIRNFSDNKDIIFENDNGAGGSTTYFYLDGSSATHDGSATTGLFTNWPDKSNISLGTSHDLRLYHDSTNSYIQNETGNLYIMARATDADISFQSDDGSGGDVEYFRVDGGNSQIRVYKELNITDSVSATFGNTSDLQIYHDATDSKIHNDTGHLVIEIDADDKDLQIFADDQSGGLAEYFRIDGSLGVNRFIRDTSHDDSVSAKFGTGNDLTIQHNGSNSYITANGTGDLYIKQMTTDKDIIFQSDDGSGGEGNYFTIDGSATRVYFERNIRMIDSGEIQLGTGGDLKLYHNATDSVIENETGNLYIVNDADDKDIIFQCDDGSGGLETYFFLDGSATSGSPVTVFPDNSYLYFGDGLDFSMAHNGSNTVVSNITGNLYFDQNTDNGSVYFRCDDGSGALTTYFQIDGNSEILQVHKSLFALDDIKLRAGSAGDLSMYHSSDNSYIENDTGNLYIRNKADDQDIIFECDNGAGSTTQYFRLDGSQATHDGSATTALLTIWPDNSKIVVGGSTDGRFWHDGTHTYLQNITGDLIIQNFADDKDILLKSDDGSGGTTEYIVIDGSATSVNFMKSTYRPDNVYSYFGNNYDFKIHHDGTNTEIENLTGNINIKQQQDDGDINFFCDDGSGGVTTYMSIDGGNTDIDFHKNAHFLDNVNIKVGSAAGGDLQIYHNASHSLISNQTGNLFIRNQTDDGDIKFQCDDGSGGDTDYITLDGGDVSTTIATIKVLMPNLPTSNPSTAGQLWNDSGTLKISAG